jgi:anti-anti-sigma factor
MPASIVVSNSTAIREAVLAEWGRRGSPESIVLDMSRTRQIDSSGAGLLLELSHKAEEAGIPVMLCGLGAAPRRMLERTGIVNRFRLCDSLADVAGATSTERKAAAVAVAPPPRRRSRRALLVFDTILALAIVGGGVYLFWQFGAYRGKLDQVQQLTPMQRLVAGISRRLDAAEAVWQNWGHEKDALLQRMEKSEDQTRRHADNQAAVAEERLKQELDQRTAALQTRMDNLEAAQQATGQRMDALEQQLNQLRPASAAAVEPSANRMQTEPPVDTHPNLDDLNRHLSQVEEQNGQTQRDVEAMRARLNRRRVEFELGVRRARELTPGISLVVSGTDVPQQKFDGRIWLAVDHQSLWIHGQGPQQPLVFYTGKDEVPRELVVTKVTANSVSGYLLLPEPSAEAASGSSRGGM